MLPEALLPRPGPAREWLRQELSHREYQQAPLARLVDWVRRLLDHLTSRVVSDGLPSLWAAVLLLALVVVLALALSRLRTTSGRAVPSAEVFDVAPESRSQHRERAELALREGRWDAAVVESVRALAAGLLQRDLVVAHLGTTAREVTAQASSLFPAFGSRLEQLATVFDDTRYGDRRATEDAAREAVRLERELDRTAPAPEGRRAVPTTAAPG